MTEMASFQGTYSNISSFDLHRPTSIAEVCELTTRFGENYMFMGGGLEVLQKLKSGMPVENLIYLKTVPGLNSVGIVSNMNFESVVSDARSDTYHITHNSDRIEPGYSLQINEIFHGHA
jgi:hypothetical protein